MATDRVISQLKTKLQMSGLSQKDQALYQVINQLIDYVGNNGAQITAVTGGSPGGGTGILGAADFLTSENNQGILPNSRPVVAGAGITLHKTPDKYIIGASLQPNELEACLGHDDFIIPNIPPPIKAAMPLMIPGMDGIDGIDGESSLLACPFPMLGMGVQYDTYCPSSATGSVNDWNPGISGNTYIDWTGASTLTITGFTAGYKGQVITIRNNANLIILQRLVTSSAPNQLNNYLNTGDTPIGPRGQATFVHDGANWKMISHDCSGLISYTPTWGVVGGGAAPVLNDGSFAGSGYYVIGNLTLFGIKLVTGAATTFGVGAWTFGLPLAAGSVLAVFNALAINTGFVPTFPSQSTLQTSTTIVTVDINSGLFWDNANPFAWGGADSALIQGWYR